MENKMSRQIINKNDGRPFLSQMMSNFPSIVVVELFSKWILLADLCLLDSSATDSSIRSGFLNQLQSPFLISFDTSVHHNTHLLIEWLTRRIIRVSILNISSVFIAFPKGFIESCTSNLKHINFDSCSTFHEDKLVVLLLSCASRLKSLSVSNCELLTDDSLLLVTNHEKLQLHLTSLSLTNTQFTDLGLVPFVTKHCKDLQSFSAVDCNFTGEGLCEVLKSSIATLTSFNCERSILTTDLESVLSTIKELLTSHPLTAQTLQSFNISHRDPLTMGGAMTHTNMWMPHIRVIEVLLRGEGRLVVAEDDKSDEYMLSVVFDRATLKVVDLI